MANKSIFLIIIIVGFGFSLIISLPAIFLSYNLLLYDEINDSKVYNFPEDLSPKVDLNITADVGNIKIQYVEPTLDTNGKIEINFNMVGAELAGKSYKDYFRLNLQTTSSSATFTLELISDSWFDPSLWSMQDVSIVISLRMDIIFDIKATVDDGDFEVAARWGVSIGNVHTNVLTGNIFYDFQYCTIQGSITSNVNEGDVFYAFEYCIIEGNITGIVNIGNIELQTFNVGYTHNNNWNFTIKNGNIKVYIYQYEDLGTNITGIVRINNGEVYIHYDDDSPDNGAILEIPFGPGFINPYGFPLCVRSDEVCEGVYGFDYTQISWATPEGIVFFTSDDLLANIVKYYYHITFEIREGSFDMDLTSIP